MLCEETGVLQEDCYQNNASKCPGVRFRAKKKPQKSVDLLRFARN